MEPSINLPDDIMWPSFHKSVTDVSLITGSSGKGILNNFDGTEKQADHADLRRIEFPLCSSPALQNYTNFEKPQEINRSSQPKTSLTKEDLLNELQAFKCDILAFLKKEIMTIRKESKFDFDDLKNKIAESVRNNMCDKVELNSSCQNLKSDVLHIKEEVLEAIKEERRSTSAMLDNLMKQMTKCEQITKQFLTSNNSTTQDEGVQVMPSCIDQGTQTDVEFHRWPPQNGLYIEGDGKQHKKVHDQFVRSQYPEELPVRYGYNNDQPSATPKEDPLYPEGGFPMEAICRVAERGRNLCRNEEPAVGPVKNRFINKGVGLSRVVELRKELGTGVPRSGHCRNSTQDTEESLATAKLAEYFPDEIAELQTHRRDAIPPNRDVLFMTNVTNVSYAMRYPAENDRDTAWEDVGGFSPEPPRHECDCCAWPRRPPNIVDEFSSQPDWGPRFNMGIHQNRGPDAQALHLDHAARGQYSHAGRILNVTALKNQPKFL